MRIRGRGSEDEDQRTRIRGRGSEDEDQRSEKGTGREDQRTRKTIENVRIRKRT